VVYDSDNVTTSLTAITVPSGELSSGTIYYWHVKYQDNYDNWSGWSAETSFTTRALSVPVAAFGASATGVVAGQDMVTFTDNSTPSGDIDKWTWDFGDGTTVTWTTRPSEGTVPHAYTDGGTYTVSLTVTNDAGNDVETKTGYVTVHAIPKAVFSSLATDQVVQFTDSSTGEITSWKWNFGDGTVVEWDATARDAASGKTSHTYDKAGTYVVSLEVTGALGTHTLNKPVEISGGGGGFHFGWWMVGVILAALLVIGGVVFLVMKRRK
jgi:PKD repeat protein